MADRYTTLGLAIAIVIAGVVFCYGAHIVYIEYRIIKRLQKFGITTTGRVVVKNKEGKGGIQQTHYVIYRFRTGDPGFKGQMFTQTQTISYYHFERLQPRQRVTVSYLLENPHISRLSGDDCDNTQRDSGIAIMGLVLVALVGVIIFLSR